MRSAIEGQSLALHTDVLTSFVFNIRFLGAYGSSTLLTLSNISIIVLALHTIVPCLRESAFAGLTSTIYPSHDGG